MPVIVNDCIRMDNNTTLTIKEGLFLYELIALYILSSFIFVLLTIPLSESADKILVFLFFLNNKKATKANDAKTKEITQMILLLLNPLPINIRPTAAMNKKARRPKSLSDRTAAYEATLLSVFFEA